MKTSNNKNDKSLNVRALSEYISKRSKIKLSISLASLDRPKIHFPFFVCSRPPPSFKEVTPTSRTNMRQLLLREQCLQRDQKLQGSNPASNKTASTASTGQAGGSNDNNNKQQLSQYSAAADWRPAAQRPQSSKRQSGSM